MSLILRQLMDQNVPEAEILRLITHWGGLPLYVPQHVSDEHPICRLAGPVVAKALVALYAGERIMVPIGSALRREISRREVLRLKAAGLNNCEIARRLCMHLRQVQRLARESE